MLHKFLNLTFTLALIAASQAVSADSRVKAVQEKLLELGYNPESLMVCGVEKRSQRWSNSCLPKEYCLMGY